MSSIAKRVPYGADASVRKRQDLERRQKEQAAARGLQSSSIGTGGVLQVKGSIEVLAPGNITLDEGDFVAANVAAAATVTAGSSVTAPTISGTSNVVGANVFAQSIATNITAGRVAVWGRTSDGFLGTASSAQRFKTALQAFDLEDRSKKLLQVSVGYFEYLAEIARRDDPTSPDYVGPDYHVSTNLGAIADQLDELGLWEWVVYERDPVVELVTASDGSIQRVVTGETLKLDDDGKPIPYGIHDILIGWAALIVCQYQESEITQLRSELATLTAWATGQGFKGAAA